MPIDKDLILVRAKDFFRENIVTSHVDGGLARASELSEYKVNPFLYKYLANFLEGNDNPESIAKALIYPRVLGTSITTTFGMRSQQMISELFEGLGSTTSGIDVEFTDAIDGRKKYCQIKAGPSTINKDDIITVKGHFDNVRKLARTNNLKIAYDDLIVGVLYGTYDDLSHHYKVIGQNYPVYVGADFWHRLTGDKNFYLELIEAIGEVALEVDGREKLQSAIEALALDIKKSLT